MSITWTKVTGNSRSIQTHVIIFDTQLLSVYIFSRISDLTFETKKIVCRRYSNYGIAALPGTGRIFKNSEPCHRDSMLSQASVHSRLADHSFVTRNAIQLHDRAEENINGRLTYPSIVLVINDLSRSTHTDTQIAAPTDRRRSVIALGGGLDNRALQAKFDSRNRNIPCMQYSK